LLLQKSRIEENKQALPKRLEITYGASNERVSTSFLLHNGREVNKGHATPPSGDELQRMLPVNNRRDSRKIHHPDLNQSDIIASISGCQ